MWVNKENYGIMQNYSSCIAIVCNILCKAIWLILKSLYMGVCPRVISIWSQFIILIIYILDIIYVSGFFFYKALSYFPCRFLVQISILGCPLALVPIHYGIRSKMTSDTSHAY